MVGQHRPDDWLWELPGVAGAEDGPAPPDGELRAYRAGALSPADTERVEWMLTRSSRGRARLAALGGVSLAPAPEALRRRVFREPRDAHVRPGLRWRWAAAIFALAIGSGTFWLWRHEPAPASELPSFAVRVEGLAETRSTGGAARALPGTAVRIVVEAEERAVRGLSYAVYRRHGTRLEKLDGEFEVHRGGAVLRTTGERLAGATTGPHELFVVIARSSRLPPRVDVVPGQDPTDALATASAGRVYRRMLEIESIENEP